MVVLRSVTKTHIMEVLLKTAVAIDFKTDSIAEIRIDVISGNRSLFAKRAFLENEVISPFYWTEVYDKPNYLTVQISENQHIELLDRKSVV